MTEGSYYHIYNRGNNSDRIFYEDENYDYFLKKFKIYLDPFVDVFSYCLMKTHFLFLLRIKEQPTDTLANILKKPLLTPIEKAFRDFFISYAKSINKKYHRTGSLFQYKFKRKQITEEKHLINLIRYIHLNPIDAGFCNNLLDYPHCSYITILNKDSSWIKTNEVIELFDDINNFKMFHFQKINNFIPDFS